MQHAASQICCDLHKNKNYKEPFPDLKLYFRAVSIGTLLGPLLGITFYNIGGPVLVFLSMAGLMAFDAAYIKLSLFKAFEIHEQRSQSFTTFLISHSQTQSGKDEFLSQNPNFALLLSLLLVHTCYVMAAAWSIIQLYMRECYLLTVVSYFIMVCLAALVTDLNQAKLKDKSPTFRAGLCFTLATLGVACLSVDCFYETGEFYSGLAILGQVLMTAGLNLLIGAVNLTLANTDVNLLNFKQIELKRSPVMAVAEVLAFVLLTSF